MLIKIKVHVLCHRVGTELSDPEVFPTYEQAYAAMDTRFRDALEEYDEGSYITGESTVGGDSAVIVTYGDWEEWEITECESEVDSLHDFAAVFGSHLNDYYAKFKQFSSGVPQIIKTTEGLLGELLNLQYLLKDAVSEATAINDDESSV